MYDDMKQLPFDIEMAKDIQYGKVEGKIVTKGSWYAKEHNIVQIFDFEFRNKDFPIVGKIIKEDKDLLESWTKEGYFNLDSNKKPCAFDLVILLP